MNKYEKGGVWTFTLQVELPVSVHSSSSSSSDPVDQAFRTFFLPEIPDSLSSVEIFISQDAANQFASTASGSILFNIQGFVQAINQVRAVTLQTWLGHATWTRVKTRLDKDATYNALMGDKNSKRVQVHGEPKKKLAGRPRKVNRVQYNSNTSNLRSIKSNVRTQSLKPVKHNLDNLTTKNLRTHPVESAGTIWKQPLPRRRR